MKKKGISEACENCLTLSCVCLLWFSYLLFLMASACKFIPFLSHSCYFRQHLSCQIKIQIFEKKWNNIRKIYWCMDHISLLGNSEVKTNSNLREELLRLEQVLEDTKTVSNESPLYYSHRFFYVLPMSCSMCFHKYLILYYLYIIVKIPFE